jgi:SOS-response transcriptional repressor LexA
MLSCAQSVQMDTGKRLSWFRAKAEHTQESLAAASGISRKRISEIEGNKGSPSLDTLDALLKACNASLQDFFKVDIPQHLDTTKHAYIYEELELLLKTPDDARFMDRLIGAVFNDAILIEKRSIHGVAEEPAPLSPSNSLRLVGHDMPQPAKFIKVPYYERIPAGDPVQLAFDQSLWMDIVHTSAKPSWWTTRVWGDSMLPEYRDGDIVLMDHDQTPRPGNIVAALIDGSEATLKVFEREGDEIILTPLNKKFELRRFHASRVQIQGVLIELVRRPPPERRTLRRKNK